MRASPEKKGEEGRHCDCMRKLKIFVCGVAEEFMSQLMPIFENLRQKEDLPCSYPLHMHAPSYHWVNNDIFLNFVFLAVRVMLYTHLSLGFLSAAATHHATRKSIDSVHCAFFFFPVDCHLLFFLCATFLYILYIMEILSDEMPEVNNNYE